MKQKSQYNISTRMMIVFSIIFLLSLISSGTAMWRLKNVSESIEIAMDKPMKKYQLANDWASISINAISRATVIAKSSDTTLVGYFTNESKRTTGLASGYQKNFKELIDSPEEQALFDKIGVVRKAYLNSREEVSKLKLTSNPEQTEKYFTTVYLPNATAYVDILYELVSMEQKIVASSAAKAHQSYEEGKMLMIILTIITLVIGISLSLLLTRNLKKELGGEPVYAANIVKKIASGDLSSRINISNNDNTSLLYNMEQMRLNLSKMINELRLSSESIATASTEIAAGNQDLSSRTEQQAASLEETASSMEELTSTVKQNADNAKFAQDLVQSTVISAQDGGKVVNDVVKTMALIKESSRKVTDIISVIDSIAFQTNILALNAAVEAARAGEQGRGFAVVASEVRNLAQRSASAAKEIKDLISDSVEKVEKGVTLVNKAGSTINEVVVNVTSVSDIVIEISEASKEQSLGIGEVTKAINHMDHATQQNAALVEEASATADMLMKQTQALTILVNKFII